MYLRALSRAPKKESKHQEGERWDGSECNCWENHFITFHLKANDGGLVCSCRCRRCCKTVEGCVAAAPSLPFRPGPGAVPVPVWNVLIGTCYERLDSRCEGFSEITNFPLQEGARLCLPASRGFFFCFNAFFIDLVRFHE